MRGFFAHYSTLPVSMAWEVYGAANGAPTFDDRRARLLSIRTRFRMETDARNDFWIGCILLEMHAQIEGGYGASVMHLPRLGEKSFRIAVLDSYARWWGSTVPSPRLAGARHPSPSGEGEGGSGERGR